MSELKKANCDRLLTGIVEMSQALKANDWEGDKVGFFIAAEMCGFGDMASELWNGCHGPDEV